MVLRLCASGPRGSFPPVFQIHRFSLPSDKWLRFSFRCGRQGRWYSPSPFPSIFLHFPPFCLFPGNRLPLTSFFLFLLYMQVNIFLLQFLEKFVILIQIRKTDCVGGALAACGETSGTILNWVFFFRAPICDKRKYVICESVYAGPYGRFMRFLSFPGEILKTNFLKGGGGE